MKQHFLKLNLDIKPLIIPDDKFRTQYHSNINVPNEVNPELISLLTKENLKIKSAHTFFSLPTFEQGIHLDDVAPFDRVKLNFVFGGAGSKMHWYKLKDNIPMPNPKLTVASRTYFSFNKNDVDCIESTEITGPTVVQVGVPHNITNMSEERLCITFLLRDLETGNIIGIDEVCSRLQKYSK